VQRLVTAQNKVGVAVVVLHQWLPCHHGCSQYEAKDASDYLTLMGIRILIVDDSKIFRQGLRTIIEAQRGWEVCGEAADGVEAIEKTRQLIPDLIVMDFSMPRMAGIEAASEIRKEFPKVPVLLLTLHLTRQLIEVAKGVGIRATVSKTKMDRLLDIIRATPRGDNGQVLVE
jgi:DNA-binding NarL/FixJ family response regulator